MGLINLYLFFYFILIIFQFNIQLSRFHLPISTFCTQLLFAAQNRVYFYNTSTNILINKIYCVFWLPFSAFLIFYLSIVSADMACQLFSCLFFTHKSSSFVFFPKIFDIYVSKRFLKTLKSYQKSSDKEKKITVENLSKDLTSNELNKLKRDLVNFKQEIIRLKSVINERDVTIAEKNKSIDDLQKKIDLLEHIPDNQLLKKKKDLTPIDLSMLSNYITTIKNFHNCNKEKALLLLNFIYLAQLANIKVHKNWVDKNTFTFGELITAIIINPLCLGIFQKDLQKTWDDHINLRKDSYMILFNLFNIKSPQAWDWDLKKILNDTDIIFDKKTSSKILEDSSKESVKKEKAKVILKPFQIRFHKELNNFFILLNELAVYTEDFDKESTHGLLSNTTLASCNIPLNWMNSQLLDIKESKENESSSPLVNEVASDNSHNEVSSSIPSILPESLDETKIE